LFSCFHKMARSDASPSPKYRHGDQFLNAAAGLPVSQISPSNHTGVASRSGNAGLPVSQKDPPFAALRLN
jgi:hypothetical protein